MDRRLGFAATCLCGELRRIQAGYLVRPPRIPTIRYTLVSQAGDGDVTCEMIVSIDTLTSDRTY